MIDTLDIEIHKTSESRLNQVDFDNLPFGKVLPITCWWQNMKTVLGQGQAFNLTETLVYRPLLQ